MDWIRIGVAAVAFILVGKVLFTGLNVPILGQAFAAV